MANDANTTANERTPADFDLARNTPAEAWREDDQRNILFYTDRLSRFGLDPRSLDWHSKESQRLRFGVLAQALPLRNRTILDVGCGLGDMWEWFTEIGEPVSYVGLDLTPEMVERARRRFPDVRFVAGSLPDAAGELGKFDCVFASGIFAHRHTQPDAYMHMQIRAMYDLCGLVLAFNSLSSWAPEQEPGEFYADPLQTLEFCRTLTPWVTLRHDYHPRDFTIYMYRGQKR